MIHERQIRDIKDYAEVAISMLAPEEYYQNFFLLDDSNAGIRENISRSTKLLQAVATEFDATIALRSFSLTQSSFNQACSQIYDQQGLSGQQIATVTDHNSIASLKRSNWVDLVSSTAFDE